MCNTYDIGSDRRSSNPLERLLAHVVSGLSKLYHIRKTDPGIFVEMAGGEPAAAVGRWGFVRPYNNAINNARSDKLDGRMWGKAWREKRRCVIPATHFYEWDKFFSGSGSKPCYAAAILDQRMCFAGLWEENSNPEFGRCYSMITTEPNETMAVIHDRMPVILHPDNINDYLTGEDPRELIQPYKGEMHLTRCHSPLKKGAKVGAPVPIG